MRIDELVHRYFREIAVVLGGVLLMGIGIVWYKSTAAEPEMEIVTAETPSRVLAASASAEIAVDISGAVVRPGVFYFHSGQRVADAMVAAGGLSGVADREAVGRSVNQAEKLRDGQKIYIPSLSDKIPNSKIQDSPAKVNINGASQAELEVLPGVGPVTAQKIIAGRPYGDVSELVSKKVLGQKVFDALKDQLQTW